MKPIVTEKAVMMIEAQNVLAFQTTKNKTKLDIKKEIEDMFKVKVEKVRTRVKDNKKYAYRKYCIGLAFGCITDNSKNKWTNNS